MASGREGGDLAAFEIGDVDGSFFAGAAGGEDAAEGRGALEEREAVAGVG